MERNRNSFDIIINTDIYLHLISLKKNQFNVEILIKKYLWYRSLNKDIMTFSF